MFKGAGGGGTLYDILLSRAFDASSDATEVLIILLLKQKQRKYVKYNPPASVSKESTHVVHKPL